MKGAAVTRSEFGSVLAMGRLDSGSTDDLAIGAPRDRVGSVRAGSVTVLLGSSTGLSTAGVGGTRYHQSTKGVFGITEDSDTFGRSVMITAARPWLRGNLIIGVPGEDLKTVRNTGSFTQLATTPAGPSGIKSRTFHANTEGTKGLARSDEAMGSSLG